MRSLNHIMYGGFHAWLLKRLGGLDSVSNATSTGWRHFIVAPDVHAVIRLGAGGYALDTRFGRAEVSWRYDSDARQVLTNVTVPVGSIAIVQHAKALPLVLSASTRATEDPWVGAKPLRQVIESQHELWAACHGRGAAAIGDGCQGRQVLPPGVMRVEQATGGDSGPQTVVGAGMYAFRAQY